MSNKKMSMFAAFCMATGTIVGAGIFGSIPSAAKMVGTGMPIIYILTAFTIVLRYLPSIVTGSALPAPFAPYMHVTRLIGPKLGFSQVLFGFNYVFILASLATVFAEYFGTYVPVDSRILGAAALALFCGLTCLGMAAGARVQNVMIILLIAALCCFIVMGFPHVKPEYITFKSVIAPSGLSIVTVGSTIGLLASTLQGGQSVMNYADELENPGKSVPLAFLLSTFLCTILFIFVSVVLIGVVPIDSLNSLKDAAIIFMPTGMYHYFIIGGAIFAILTSMNGALISASRMIGAVAVDQVLPDWFGKRNKNNVPYNAVWFVGGAAIIIVVFRFPIGTLLSAFSLLTMLCGLLFFVAAVRFPKLYPHCYKNAYLKLTPTWIAIISVLGAAVSVWQIASIFMTIDVGMAVAIVLWVGGWYAFYFIRRAYLRKKGIDLDAIMTAPYPEWVEKEKMYAVQESNNLQ